MRELCSQAAIEFPLMARSCGARNLRDLPQLGESGCANGAAVSSAHDPLRTASKRLHSITSSAATSSVGGAVSPSALAVLRLITNSNLVGCAIGRSAGFSPFRILSADTAA